MRTLDLSPLFRSSVGFDRVNALLEAAMRADETPSYPPYNIERRGENSYRISMAVAGFTEENLKIITKENALTIEGRVERAEEEGVEMLHRGIGARSFRRAFQLADHIKVTSAELENGLLHIGLEREVPDALKPREVAITKVLPSAS